MSPLEAAAELRRRLHGRKLAACRASQAIAESCWKIITSVRSQPGGDPKDFPLFQPGRDQHTPYHQAFYSEHKASLYELYAEIYTRVITEVIKEPAYVQATPTYRIGFPGNRWVGNYHRDSDFGHSPYELNTIIALTPMQGTAALHVESAPNSRQFQPLELGTGEFVLFDHIDRLHGCPINQESAIVASIDFRFIPSRWSKEAFSNTKQSINTGTSFLAGAYFTAQPVEPS